MNDRLQYLANLCEQEVARRYQSRISKWTHEAKLPSGKSFETLLIDQLPEPVQKKVVALRENSQWALQADNVLLIGPCEAMIVIQVIARHELVRGPPL